MKAWAQRSKKERAEIVADRDRKRRQVQEITNALKRRPCMDCGGTFPPEAMDFDQGRGGKLAEVSKVSSIGALYSEALKCDVVCSNCHRIRTRKRKHAASFARAEKMRRLDGIVAAVEREREARKELAQ